MSNIGQRFVTGVFFTLTLLLGIIFGKYSFTLLFLVITALGLREFYKLLKGGGYDIPINTGVVAGSLFYLICTLYLHKMVMQLALILIVPLIFSIFIIELFRKSETPIINIAIILAGIMYFAFPMVLLSYLAYPPAGYEGFELYHYNPNVIIGFFLLLWTSDSFAYVFGVKFGKQRLFERISPKKSWEGSMGGAAICYLCAYLLSLYFVELSLVQWMVVASIIIVFGTLGDLIQSMFKRSMNVKDTGTILPGHGGILDRFDGVLLSVPFVMIYLQFLK